MANEVTRTRAKHRARAEAEVVRLRGELRKAEARLVKLSALDPGEVRYLCYRADLAACLFAVRDGRAPIVVAERIRALLAADRDAETPGAVAHA